MLILRQGSLELTLPSKFDDINASHTADGLDKRAEHGAYGSACNGDPHNGACHKTFLFRHAMMAATKVHAT
jgi:hypothetical protein